jgi:hypothetical protein
VAAERCRDLHFGLSVSALVQPLDFGALDYALYSRATLGESRATLGEALRGAQQGSPAPRSVNRRVTESVVGTLTNVA